ncbi:hypothetical protein ACMU_05800 [Actibacterium mucosum KCTC 23349]|uniref:Lipoprotein n=1 Tax=Actibacterium mucosum KCTC 23349 TaxID=1454373 RepID=A0A037ZNR7_9RHOB|nr:DUF2927 domain-containing protein [Actibacterium mucosum]KAJ56456.1 hypothetical protein ACMU_05800 [Actibacterium mucosum KCTC 23349]
MKKTRRFSFLSVLAVSAGLFVAGCEAPVTQTSPTTAPTGSGGPEARSAASRAVSKHFARVQSDFLSRGLMRTDLGTTDAPFSRTQLEDNFVRIALFDEYTSSGGRIIAQRTPSNLRRWQQPVRMRVEFGPSIGEEQRALDRKSINDFARRLGKVTRHDIAPTSAATANFHVLVLNEDDRRGYGPRLRQLVPGIDDIAVRTITSMPRSTFCLVFAFSRSIEEGYIHAIAVIRGEHPDLLRLSCIHEELAQGLGLANDSPEARPSVFNDDEEFALLTKHDELLLRILYDRRLQPGMSAAEVRPILRQITTELVGAG